MPRSSSTEPLGSRKRGHVSKEGADDARKARCLTGTSNDASGPRVRGQQGAGGGQQGDGGGQQGAGGGQQGDGKEYTETYTALYEFVQALECPLCSRLMDKPSTFSTCGHTFCFECVIETLEGKGIRWPGCPTCKQPGCRKDLQTNHLVGNAVGQVRRMMEDLARARVRERERLNRSGQDTNEDGSRRRGHRHQTMATHDGTLARSPGVQDDVNEEIENVSGDGLPEKKVVESIEVNISGGTGELDLPHTEETGAQPLGSLASPVLVGYGELEADVELLRAGLEWADALPIAQGSRRVSEDASASVSPSGSTQHLLVRQDSDREHSIVPDSQVTDPGGSVMSKRILQERSENALKDAPAEQGKLVQGGGRSLQDAAREIAPNHVKGAETSPSKISPSSNATTRKKSLAAFWKRKQQHSGASGGRKGMRIVVDARTIADDPTVITLVEKLEAKYGDLVTVADEISPDTTHFVTSMDARSLTRLTVEYLEACAVGCWVVAPSWLEDSLEHSEDIVEEKYYAAQGHMRDDGTTHMGLPENSRIRAIAGKKLFLGQYFVLAPGSERRDQLMRLIEFAGGTFLDVDETGSPLSEPQTQTQSWGTQASQKKMTCVVDSKKLSAMTAEQSEQLLALREGGRIAVVNERWLYESCERGQAQLRNDGYYVL